MEPEAMETVLDDRVCALGEGPLWHPVRHQLFWFDILGQKMLSVSGGEKCEWSFDGAVSAAGWVDRDRLLIASEVALVSVDLTSGARQVIVALEAGDPGTRSNDGRADPWGGFWISTMGKNAEPGAGSIYRFLNGKATRVISDLTVPNSIAFAPDRSCAYFCDSATGVIMRQGLDGEGWPEGAPEVFLGDGVLPGVPDGSVVDAAGNLWNARWDGGGLVACIAPDGTIRARLKFKARRVTCPAFVGSDLDQLCVTTATVGLSDPAQEDGRLLRAGPKMGPGLAEYQVIL